MKLTAQHIETLKLLGFTEAEVATFESVLNEDPHDNPGYENQQGARAKGTPARSHKF